MRRVGPRCPIAWLSSGVAVRLRSHCGVGAALGRWLRLELVAVEFRGRVDRLDGSAVLALSPSSSRRFRCCGRRRGRGHGARRFLGVAVDSPRPVGSTTGTGTGILTDSDCGSLMGGQPVTRCPMIVPQTIRPDFRSPALGNPLSPIRLIRSIASSLSWCGLRNCSTRSKSTAWVRRSILGPLHQRSDDRDVRHDPSCRHEWGALPRLRGLYHRRPGGPRSPKRRDDLAVATARASDDSRCRPVRQRFASACR